MNQAIIQPAIGRRVWYWPSALDFGRGAGVLGVNSVMNALSSIQPFDAGIVFVHDDRLVNLIVTDHFGFLHSRLFVKLVQPGDDPPAGGGYAQWMTYQREQAEQVAAIKAGGTD